MQVYFYDIENKLPLGNAQQVATLEELLSTCDAISLHVPENASTKNLIDAKRLAQMKEGAVLVNAARGTVVDIDALVEVLKTDKLRGAALDVFPEEPASASDPFESPLC
ncbi:NAD(P)-dependent oxidoreductase, partial [Glaesserella parasuis]|nr:NAD(P)-dependent oxidoreductase [Glaesserella parasuis]